jgi:hypothetical protein
MDGTHIHENKHAELMDERALELQEMNLPVGLRGYH